MLLHIEIPVDKFDNETEINGKKTVVICIYSGILLSNTIFISYDVCVHLK